MDDCQCWDEPGFLRWRSVYFISAKRRWKGKLSVCWLDEQVSAMWPFEFLYHLMFLKVIYICYQYCVCIPKEFVVSILKIDLRLFYYKPFKTLYWIVSNNVRLNIHWQRWRRNLSFMKTWCVRQGELRIPSYCRNCFF